MGWNYWSTFKSVQGFSFKPRSGGGACSHFSLSCLHVSKYAARFVSTLATCTCVQGALDVQERKLKTVNNCWRQFKRRVTLMVMLIGVYSYVFAIFLFTMFYFDSFDILRCMQVLPAPVPLEHKSNHILLMLLQMSFFFCTKK